MYLSCVQCLLVYRIRLEVLLVDNVPLLVVVDVVILVLITLLSVNTVGSQQAWSLTFHDLLAFAWHH